MPIQFDQFQRYGIAARAIEAARVDGKPLTILEVGANTHKLLGRLLPNDRILYLDREIPQDLQGDTDFVLGDATDLNLPDASYDVVVALDVFEHIPQDLREMFLKHTSRVARLLTLIGAPFDRPGVSEAEKEASEYWGALFHTPYRWLDEHAQNGLPDLDASVQALAASGFATQVIHHGELGLWKDFIKSHFAEVSFGALQPVMTALYRYYQDQAFDNDFAADSYRQFILTSRSAAVVQDVGRQLEPGVQAASDAAAKRLLRELVQLIPAVAQEKAQLAAEASRLSAEFARLSTDMHSAAQTIEAQQHAHAELIAQHTVLQQSLSRVSHSLSWRVTRPLRLINRVRAEVVSRLWPSRVPVVLEPAQQVGSHLDGYVSTGSDPYFLIRVLGGRPIPSGLCELRYRGAAKSACLTPTIYVDDGAGFREQLKFELVASRGNWVTMRLQFPQKVRALRLDPLEHTGPFSLTGFEIKRLPRWAVVAEFMLPRFADSIRHPRASLRRIGTVLKLLRQGGLAGLKHHIASSKVTTGTLSYRAWVEAYDDLNEDKRAALAQASAQLARKPLISVLMPVYNPPVDLLDAAIRSVRAQIYPHWELCVADDASPNPEVRALLQSHAAEEPRIKLALRDENGHISAASNSALELATGEYVALLDHDDLLSEQALFWIVREINAHPEARLIYSDEDKISLDGERFAPYFKCDWNYELFLSHNMVSHLGVYRTELVRSVGGFRQGLEGSQDYDLALRCVEQIGSGEIRHIPRVLYHWRVLPGSTAMAGSEKPYALIAGERALAEHLSRTGRNGSVQANGKLGVYRIRYPLPDNPPLVSLIIPTRNGLHLIRQCVDSILNLTTYPEYEIIVVDNGSDEPAVLEYFHKIAQHSKVRILRDDRPFNYSALNNHAVSVSRGEIIGLINNDIEVITPDWLEEMVSLALQSGVGAVGARLWYPNDTMQHGGVIMGIGGIANHAHKGIRRNDPGYFARAAVTQNYSAVTAACLVVQRAIYTEIGGLNERDLTVAYNDVDFCLRLIQAGYRNVWTPYADLYHHESATRGLDDSPEKRKRFLAESCYMECHWKAFMEHDPAYSPNLTVEREDFSLAWPPRVELIESCLVSDILE
ncbi:glycosyltransferase [Cupriavidus pinatubonensis]|nr:glycosyltransferase [Cupriavidus pinatubonensis]